MFSNKYPGRCFSCAVNVPANKGKTFKHDGRWAVVCRACEGEVKSSRSSAPVAPVAPRVERVLTAAGEIFTPKEPENLPLLRAFPGARWLPEKRCWSVSLDIADRERVLELADRLGLDVAPSLRAFEHNDSTRKAIEVALDSRLYEYQVDGVRFLASHDRCLLADDMGLGKTVQVIVALPPNAAVLVIAPKAVTANWRAEFAKWRPGFRTFLCGKKDFRLPKKGEVVIVTYESLPEDVLVQDEIILVADEAHKVKNFKAARSRRVEALAKQEKVRVWGLTGTPLLSRPMDLWGIYSSLGLARKTFGPFEKFKRLFGAYKGRYGLVWGDPAPEVPELLRRSTLRRRKAEVLKDLPAKRYTTHAVDVSSSLVRELDRVYVEVLKTNSLPDFTSFSSTRAALAEAKIPALLELVDSYEETDTPLLVFSAHRAPVDALAQREGWATITGDTSADARQQIVESFQAGRLKGVALTIAAGGVGLTLTRASTVLFVDLDWTPALNAQAEDRVCRIGQTADSINIVHMLVDHPLEHHVHTLLHEKARLIQASVEAEVTASVPSSEELRRLEAEIAERALAQALAMAATKAASEKVATLSREKALSRIQGVLGREKDKAGEGFEEKELTPEYIETLRGNIDFLVGRCDGAVTKDGQGFNKPDSAMGYWLVASGMGDETSLRLAEALSHRYRRQLASRAS